MVVLVPFFMIVGNENYKYKLVVLTVLKIAFQDSRVTCHQLCKWGHTGTSEVKDDRNYIYSRKSVPEVHIYTNDKSLSKDIPRRGTIVTK